MNKFLVTFFFLFFLASISFAQNRYWSDSANENPREKRKFALTNELGWKCMSGTGINLTYYPISQLAVDAGLGLGFQGLKLGTRARYLILDRRFSPIIGMGFNTSPMEIGFNKAQTFTIDHDLDENTPSKEVSLNAQLRRSYYGQFITGVEWMANNGFVCAFNIGFRLSLNQTIDTQIEYEGISHEVADQFTDNIINSVDFLYGHGLSTSIHFGYAF